MSKTGTRTSKTLFVIVAFTMALFLLSFADYANAQFSVTGKIVSVDKVGKTLTIDPYYPYREGEFKQGQTMSFSLTRLDPYDRKTTRDAWVMFGNETKRIEDLRVGDWVTVTYHQESDGRIVGDGVAITAPPALVIPERRAAVMAPGESKALHSDAGLLSFSGRVIAIDKSSRMLALEPTMASGGVKGEPKFFALRPDTLVLLGNESRDFSDLKIGDWVTVNYHQESLSNVIADSIAITPPAGTMYREGTSLTYPEGRFSLTGQVVSIDHDSKILIVKPYEAAGTNYSGFKGNHAFALKDGAMITMKNESRNFEDLKVGDWVTVSYYEDSRGNIVADGVAISSPSTLPFPEERG
jgi:hypothetical protein